MIPEPDCNVCGADDVYTTEIGAMKSNGSSGSIGMGICDVCRDAADWHDEHGGEQCASCGEETPSRTIQLAPPHRGGWTAEIELCRDCYNRGGIMHMYESDTKLRGRANVVSTWDEQRRAALMRDSYECQSCGVGDCRLHVHHKIPRSEGGSDHLENLTTLCPDCHADKHNKHSCMLCGSLTDQALTWLDTSGGTGEFICDACRDYIERGGGSARCSICARFYEGEGRSEGLIFDDDDPDDYSIYGACDQCRKKLLFGDWPERQRYIDEELPDSHANVRHWESDARGGRPPRGGQS